ncbi:hypothetical protein EV356DRAFT_575802 [Viridothelium virens]|uniref:Uncharacterized protein n=1 Tax=Viridothelium virens TaxID=1048519 RepID=A0A6A6HC45_VIRVR|nr:hypothetical protein EV356DRAFT_575802 [Viridothelium virens]
MALLERKRCRPQDQEGTSNPLDVAEDEPATPSSKTEHRRQEKAIKSEAQPQITAVQAMVLQRVKGKKTELGPPFFSELPSSTTFSNLWNLFQVYATTWQMKAEVNARVEIGTLFALCINDYMSNWGKIGRMRHQWARPGGNPQAYAQRPHVESTVFFGARAWSKKERESYQQQRPVDRARGCGWFSPVHWLSPDTRAIQLQVFSVKPAQGREAGEGDDQRTQVRLNFRDADNAIQDAKQNPSAVLIYTGKELLFTTMVDLIHTSMRWLGTKGPQDDTDIAMLEGPALIKRNKMLDWVLCRDSEQCQKWIEARQMQQGDRMEEALFDRLSRMVMDDDEVVQPWGVLYDAITPEGTDGA